MPAPLAPLPPAELAALSQDEFERMFAGTPIRRIGLQHLQHNARKFE